MLLRVKSCKIFFFKVLQCCYLLKEKLENKQYVIRAYDTELP